MRQKKVAIVQSNYAPWLGYFILIASVDEFILYDDAQFTKRDWRNRNKIKTPNGPQWLTVPVATKGKYTQAINETQILDGNWQTQHWKTLCANYKKAHFAEEIFDLLYDTYNTLTWSSLSELNRHIIMIILNYLGVSTRVTTSSDYSFSGNPSQKLASIAEQAFATHYVSGPTAKTYLDQKLFDDIKIRVEWFNYPQETNYRQLWGEFIPRLSIIDLLMNIGKETKTFITI